MPNWCENHINSVASQRKLEEIRLAFENSRLLSYCNPLSGKYHRKEAIQKWGTKWDIDFKNDVHSFNLDHIDDNYVLFINANTAWSPPLEALDALFDQDEVHSVHCDFHEPMMEFCGLWANGHKQVLDYHDSELLKLECNEYFVEYWNLDNVSMDC